MGRQTVAWQGGEGQQFWLSLLVDAMEEASRPEVRARPCAPAIIAGLRAQLSQPAPHYLFAASAFSLRN